MTILFGSGAELGAAAITKSVFDGAALLDEKTTFV
jgi:hypothetical protein